MLGSPVSFLITEPDASGIELRTEASDLICQSESGFKVNEYLHTQNIRYN